MYRMQLEDLLKWKNRPKRKPLLLTGARQVGKTWLAKEFGRLYFQKVAYINMDNNKTMRDLFELGYDIDNILAAYQIESGVNITPEDTLIIIDEIQEVPKALSSLKYFCENAPQYTIIATGSMLGIALHEGTSFPVGKLNMMTLYPMTYYEYLKAIGKDNLADLLASGNYELIKLYTNDLILKLKEYYYVGGMPEVVQTFIDTHDYKEVRNLQNELLAFYSNDFSKHAPASTAERIQMVWSTLPRQLSKENKKFIYCLIREGARAREYETAIQWLLDIGLIRKCYRLSKPYFPLKSYVEPENFKIYLFDVGLLSAMSNLDVHTILEEDKIFVDFKGALTEQFVAGELSACGIPLYYYSTPNSDGEIDFILQQNSRVIPLEVKAKENLKAKSLKAYRDKYQPELSIKTSLSDYKEQDGLINVPLYLIGEYLKDPD